MVLAVIAGALIITGVLWEAFETIVLPRRVSRRFRFAVLVYRITWLPWRAIAHRHPKASGARSFLSIYGPLSLLILFVLWAAAIVFGFGLVYYGVSRELPPRPAFPLASI